MAISNKQKHRIKKRLLRENPKEFWQMPLWVLKKPSGLLSEDSIQKCKLINNESFLIVKRERFLQGLSRR